ncbi:MAG TPA: tyrosine--tRNA ligase [Candidatus Saccharimonadales bacterium]|nr:tyrosine--tRNA ligase [Candidatus Saccharimonadales bacterium]
MLLSEELKWRGFVHQSTFNELTDLDKSTLTFYWGVDPSADSMTIGNLAAAMLVKCLIKHGYKPVLLVGGATGLIGDPDGKADERSIKPMTEIQHNKEAIIKEYRNLFSGVDLKIVDNYDWFKGMTYLDFLRDVGKHVPMSQMLAREFVQTRLGENGSGISYAEFSYVLIQAYDFLVLNDRYGVSLQVCGSDQWGNSIAGVDLIRRKTGKEAHVYSVPLIVNKATGKKFGKSEEGAIWLNPTKTTPTTFYQFWINADDAGVEDYLKVYTELDPSSVSAIMQEQLQNPEKRPAQKLLAHEVTKLVHGPVQTQAAEAVTEVLVDNSRIAEISDEVAAVLRAEVSSATTNSGGTIVDALVAAGLAVSKTDARRLLQSNAISINGQKVSRDNFIPEDFINGRLLIRRGKAFKDTAVIELG